METTQGQYNNKIMKLKKIIQKKNQMRKYHKTKQVRTSVTLHPRQEHN